jgi:polysaccharide export outer membrane protein
MMDISLIISKVCHFISSHKSMRKFNFKTSAGLLILTAISLNSFSVHTAYSQSAAQVTEAKAKLSTMTPDEIKAAVAKYGMTMEEAQAKANSVGIDLESYLKGRSANETPAAQPQTQVNIQVSPTQATPVGNAGQPAVSTPGVQMLSASGNDTTKQGAQIPGVQAPVVQPSIQAPGPLTPPQVAAPIMGPDSIPYFGYNLFRAGPTAFEARPNLADNSYIVGEGDVLRIALWGDTQSMYEYTVDTEGRILIQPAGPVLVAGYTLDQSKARVIRALSQSLSGLIAKPPTTFLDLTIARLRPVRAFIMGEVTNPGTYSLSSFATVFNSLFTVGGPLVSGGMREVRLVRNGKAVVKVDLYDYLIGSEKTGDVRVNDNDIIYVPLRGRTVGIRGAVLRTAYFELLPNEQLKRLLDFSGGIRNTFYLQRIQVDRIVPFAERKKGEFDRKIFDIDFSEILKSGKDFKLEDGDIVTVFPILEEKKNFVTIEGAVWRPGTYQLDKISTIKDLVQAADGLKPDVYNDYGVIVRTYENKHTEIFTFQVGRAIQGNITDNLSLQPRDTVQVFTWEERLTSEQTVTLEGKAKRPGIYRLRDNRTLYNLVDLFVGLSDTLFRKEVYLSRADLVRFNDDHYATRIIPFNLWDLYDKRIGDTLLLPGDRIIIYPITTIKFEDRYVDIAGKVKSPGRYALSENMTLFDLLIQAGGYTEDAWSVQAEIARLERNGLGKDSLSRITFAQLPDLFDTSMINSEAITNYRAASIRLQHRDQVFIRPNPNYIFQQTVTVNGEVEHPGAYVISKLNERLSDVLKRAGGVKKSGYAEGGKVTRGGTRIRINIYDAIDNPEGNNDIKLQPGDTISIPQSPFTVQVAGEVCNPGVFTYVDGKSLSYYIKQSGSETDSADFVLVTYPTGMVEQAGLHWWSKNPNIPDGTSIFVVKEKPAPPEPVTAGPKTTTFDFLKDMLAIAVSAATVIVLASKM